MSAAPPDNRPPTLAIVGGAGTMGSLFAELLLPRVRACLLVDLFPRPGDDGSPRTVLPASLVERLAPPMARRNLDLLIVTSTASSTVEPVLPRDVRGAPVWLLFHPPGAVPSLTGLRSGVSGVDLGARLTALPNVRHAVGLVDPSEALAVARLADVLLIATTYTSANRFQALLTPYAAGLRPGSLVADLLSIKEAPLRVLADVLPPEVGLLGTHPLFGRAVSDVTGLVVAVAPAPDGRPEVQWQPWLLEQLAELGLLMTPTSAAEHDAAMSYVQALAHFCLLSFAFTFVRANQDPTPLLPFRTPVFEPLLYLAARVASQAQRSPEVYRAIQMECARPELRRLFVETAQDLLRAIERGEPSLPDLLQALGAPWAPAYHRHAEPYEHLVAMSSVLTEPVNALRHELLKSAGRVRALRHTHSGTVTLGALYVDPLHHDRVDLASRVRFRRFNPTSGILEGVAGAELVGLPEEERRAHTEAALGSLPLANVQLLTEQEMLDWLGDHTAPRTGPDEPAGATAAGAVTPRAADLLPRTRYAGKARFDLSLLVPQWLDDDCLQRLLGGRSDRPDATALIWRAALLPQQVPDLPPAPGLHPAIVRVTVLLHPEEVLALRDAAHQRAGAVRAGVDRKARRQQEDRFLASALAARQAELREFALAWLLDHGCQLVQVRPSPHPLSPGDRGQR